MYTAVRAPLRISFFGGGTDYPEYFRDHPGAVLGMAIDQYIYVTALNRPRFLKHEFQLSYSQLERVTSIGEIAHPAIRKALELNNFVDPLDLTTLASLPSQTGLGSSATFMVGLLQLLATIGKTSRTKYELALEAIRIEREELGHTCGVQDQLHAAFGGWNCFEFQGTKITQRPVLARQSVLESLTRSMYLVFTGQTRSAPQAIASQIEATVSGQIGDELAAAYDMVGRGLCLIERGDSNVVQDFGKLLHEGWLLKKSFSKSVSNENIDNLYQHGLQNGAIGGKLCGAGSGGFLLFVVDAEREKQFLSAFEPTSYVKVGCDWQGVILLNA